MVYVVFVLENLDEDEIGSYENSEIVIQEDIPIEEITTTQIQSHSSLTHSSSNKQYILFPYRCKMCNSRFNDESEWIRHEENDHTVERPVKCPVPGCRFRLKFNNFSIHARIHSNIKKYSCSICGKKYKRLSGRIAHFKSQHLQERVMHANVVMLMNNIVQQVEV